MPHDVFISHSSVTADKAIAEQVCRYLESQGFPCWIAPRDILEGDDFAAVITNAILECRVLVLIFSAAANSSRHVARELKLADDAHKPVLPIRTENVAPTGTLAFFVAAAHWLDSIGGIGDEQLARLALGLRRRLVGQARSDSLGASATIGPSVASTNTEGRLPIRATPRESFNLSNAEQLRAASLLYDHAKPRDQWTTTTLEDFRPDGIAVDQAKIVTVLKSLADGGLVVIGKWDRLGALQVYPSGLSDDEMFCSGSFLTMVTKEAAKKFKLYLKKESRHDD